MTKKAKDISDQFETMSQGMNNLPTMKPAAAPDGDRAGLQRRPTRQKVDPYPPPPDTPPDPPLGG